MAFSINADCLYLLVVSGRRSMAKMRNTLSKPTRKRNFKPKRPGRKPKRKGEREIQDGVPKVVKLLDLLSLRAPLKLPLCRTRKRCIRSQSNLRQSRRNRFTRLGRRRSFVNRRWELYRPRSKHRKSCLINLLFYCYVTRIL